MNKPKCQCCNQDLNTYIQEPMYPGGTAREYGECKNRDCAEYDVTLLVIDGVLCNPQTRIMSTEGA